MKLLTQLNIPFEIKIYNKPIFYKDIQIGKISNSYIKNNKLWITLIIDKKKKQFFKNLAKLLKEIKYG